MARRSIANRYKRNLIKIAGGKSIAVTIPIEYIRELGWDGSEEVKVTLQRKNKRIIIEPLTGNNA
jgi:antitoxin component of MazEF toxin-antitoxin module